MSNGTVFWAIIVGVFVAWYGFGWIRATLCERRQWREQITETAREAVMAVIQTPFRFTHIRVKCITGNLAKVRGSVYVYSEKLTKIGLDSSGVDVLVILLKHRYWRGAFKEARVYFNYEKDKGFIARWDEEYYSGLPMLSSEQAPALEAWS